MPAQLHIEDLPDGVRYILPRRRRRAWLPLRHAAVAFLLYIVVAIFAIGLTMSVARYWIAPVALIAALVLLLGGIGSIRSAWAILAAPDVELSLLTGRLEINRHSLLGGAATVTVPIAAMRRLVVQSLVEPSAAAQRLPGVVSGLRRRLGAWFGPSAEQRRAEERRDSVQRFFGTLVLEGDDDAAVLLADGCSLTYLRTLAEDLATRCAARGQQVEVAADRVALIAADDARLQRPDGLARVQILKSADGCTIDLPAVGLRWWMALALVAVALIAVVVIGALLPSAVTVVEILGFGLVFLWIGIPLLRGVYAGGSLLLARLQRTVLTIRAGKLWVCADYGPWRRERCWPWEQVAAFTLVVRSENSGKDTKQPRFLHDLVLIDHGMAQTCLIPARAEAELEWIVALLHQEMGLGL